MNKLLIPNGGMPFTGDDLLWMQSGLTEGFLAMMSMMSRASLFNDDSLILVGVNFTLSGTDLIYSAGYVALAGEIYYVPAGTAVGAVENDAVKSTFAIVPKITYDPTGSDIFADSVTKDTYEVRQAAIEDYGGSLPAGGIRLDLHHSYRYRSTYAPQPGEYENSWVNSTDSFVLHKIDNVIYFKGGITGGTTNLRVCVLPEHFRPITTKSFVLSSSQTSDNTMYRALIYPNGDFFIYIQSQQSVSGTLNLAGIVYPIT